MQDYFYEVADLLAGKLKRDEHFTCWFSAESTDFIRFNRGLIRQPGHVEQIYLSVELIDGLKHAHCSLTLSGKLSQDCQRLADAVGYLRDLMLDLNDDPHFQLASEGKSSEYRGCSDLPRSDIIVDDIMQLAKAFDFVGILASGPIYRGFANSFGQRNWHQLDSFNLDWSLFYEGDKAVKSAYAGFAWNSVEFQGKFDSAASRLAMLKQKPVSLNVGEYRAFLSPTALSEIIALLNWGGFSEKSLRTQQSPLSRMREIDLSFNGLFSLSEKTAEGIAPAFQKEGYNKPNRVALIERGRLVGSMISPRSAKEYALLCNGADANEMPVSIDIDPGEMPSSQILRELGTGVYIGNLWYLNFSNRSLGRVTGMTRFATFWVENGEIKAPLNVMRFDDSLFHLLGDNLIALTVERELLIDSESYGQRSISSMRLPGALVKSLRFVL